MENAIEIRNTRPHVVFATTRDDDESEMTATDTATWSPGGLVRTRTRTSSSMAPDKTTMVTMTVGPDNTVTLVTGTSVYVSEAPVTGIPKFTSIRSLSPNETDVATSTPTATGIGPATSSIIPENTSGGVTIPRNTLIILIASIVGGIAVVIATIGIIQAFVKRKHAIREDARAEGRMIPRTRDRIRGLFHRRTNSDGTIGGEPGPVTPLYDDDRVVTTPPEAYLPPHRIRAFRHGQIVEDHHAEAEIRSPSYVSQLRAGVVQA